MTSSARDIVLARIRRSLGSSPADPAPHDWANLRRDYRQSASLSPNEQLDLLEERLRDYDAEVTRVEAGDVAADLRRLLAPRGEKSVLHPPGFPSLWLPDGIAFEEDQGFSPRELDRFDTVLTTATLAIAETGTLVLQNVPGQGRRATTLVPDSHLCVVRAADVVETVPQAFVRLAGTATLPTTFVSGPSATADIEMTRIKGVHGPRFLHVVLVMDQSFVAQHTSRTHPL